MIIRSVRHRGLRRLLEHDDPRFVRSEWIARVRKILTVLWRITFEETDGCIDRLNLEDYH